MHVYCVIINKVSVSVSDVHDRYTKTKNKT